MDILGQLKIAVVHENETRQHKDVCVCVCVCVYFATWSAQMKSRIFKYLNTIEMSLF